MFIPVDTVCLYHLYSFTLFMILDCFVQFKHWYYNCGLFRNCTSEMKCSLPRLFSSVLGWRNWYALRYFGLIPSGL